MSGGPVTEFELAAVGGHGTTRLAMVALVDQTRSAKTAVAHNPRRLGPFDAQGAALRHNPR